MSRPNHREALLEAAKRLLREKGYARTTARDLVAASDTNLGSIGYHFGSKEALLNEAIGESFAEWTDRLSRTALAGEDVSPLARLSATWRAMLDDFAETRPIFVAFVEALAQAERSPALRAQLAGQYEECRRQIASSVIAVLGGDDAPGSDAHVFASWLIAVSDGLLLQLLLDPERAPSGEELSDALGRTLAAALAP